MQRSAADKIERGFGRNEGTLGGDGQTPDRAPETPVRAKFEPKQPKIRRPGTGCIFKISEKKWEGSYSPKLPNGKRKKFNIYADTREECEERLAEMIKQKNAEIAAGKERLKSGRTVRQLFRQPPRFSAAVARCLSWWEAVWINFNPAGSLRRRSDRIRRSPARSFQQRHSDRPRCRRHRPCRQTAPFGRPRYCGSCPRRSPF